MVQSVLLIPKPKRSVESPSFPKKVLLEKEPAELVQSGCPNEIHGFITKKENHPIPEDLQNDLSSRFYSSAHNRSAIRLLVPLAISVSTSAIVLPLNEAVHALSNLQLAVGYLVGIFIATFYGNHKSIHYERTLSPIVVEIFDNGGATTEVAQERYSYLISDAKDAKNAAALLSSNKLTSYIAQEILADTIYKHGTKEQADTILKTKPLTNLAENILRIKAGSDDNRE